VAAAEASGLIELGARIRFRHPLVRSAVYRAASPEEKQQVNHVLSEVTDSELDPDRRAWHRAQATPAPDEVERAALLTPEPVRRREGDTDALPIFAAQQRSRAPRRRRPIRRGPSTSCSMRWRCATRRGMRPRRRR
jgi:hypothetical protein